MYATLITAAALWGLLAGLLVPRAAYRLSVEPGEPWRAACAAGHPFAGPGRGWLGGARCAACAACAVTVPAGAGSGGRTGDRTEDLAPSPGVPTVTALSCAALAAATGFRPELAVWLLFTPVAVLLAVVDRRVHRLPDHLTLPLAAAVTVLLGAAALVPAHTGSWSTALLGGLLLGGFYFVLFLINPDGMGFGDVKLALSLGVVLGWYGWGILFAGAFGGLLFGAVYGMSLVLARRASRKAAIPFGPFMVAGALVGLLAGGLTV
ncbi:prepilin peptidase [Streptomyces verrucosisporus]|uniref:prepilin peptidase n=1 Tax=Streptomyces verrucosisporus TaxID=1695161 RepID=UPI0019D148D1|nr:A24 family peptidase [Streptomyces verrucosisporus]MBN3930454.1 prepilin peptidase [Streptomyces verrucosisporus]